MGESINQYWEQLSDFIKYRSSLDIGALNHLHLSLANKTPEHHIFIAQIISFLESISAHAKNHTQQYSEALALMALDALIYNLYKIAKGNDQFKSNSSSFYGWMSTSHLSGDLSELSNQGAQKQPKKLIGLIQAVANSEQLFKRIKLALDRNTNKQRNQRYGQNLIQTLDYIINKQKCEKETFKKLKAKYISNSISLKKHKTIDYKAINSIIFSNQINQIVKILTEGQDQLHLALIRIYFAASQNIERKQFQGHQYSANDILYNLYRFYIQNFDDKNQLFQQSKSPVYRLLKNILIQIFAPIFKRFHTIVSRICQKGDEENAYQFYKNNSSVIERQLLGFISLIPNELVKILNTLYTIIDNFYKNGYESSLTPIKKFIFYSFLLSETVMNDLVPQLDPLKYTHSYNHILLLFFQNSIKKYSQYNQSQLTFISNLIDTISNALDERILSPEIKILNEQLQQPLEFQFTITEPILNHDYELIEQIIHSIEFTPKDSKAFPMKHPHELKVESPIYKPFRKETEFISQIDMYKEEQIDLVTWMSVGGSRQWTKSQPKQSKTHNRLKQKLSKLQTLKGARISQLQKLKGQFQYYL